MEWLQWMVELVLHFDRHLEELIQAYGAWTYVILFTIVFLETGIVFTPFLPGDSLIFAAGALTGRGLNPWLIFVSLSVAAIAGDTLNYWIGKYFGTYMVKRHSRFIKQEHLDRTHAFFEKYGGKTIIIARFVPIVRTFAPFVAGMGAMTYSKFLFYNIFGGILWVGACTLAGFWFGQLEIVKKNFSLVVLVIVALSVLPIVWEFLRHRWAAKPQGGGGPVAPATRADVREPGTGV